MNEPERGAAPAAERLINDVVALLSAVGWDRNRACHSQGVDGFPDVRAPEPAERPPVCLLGVSWGGKLAAATAFARPDLLDGLALQCPGIVSRFLPGRVARCGLSIAEWLGLRRRRVPIPLSDPQLFTDSPEHQEFIRSDPQTLRHVALSWLHADRELDRRLRACLQGRHWRRTPRTRDWPAMLLQLAGRDRIVDNAALKQWWTSLPPGRRDLREYPYAAHTLDFDPAGDAASADLIAWLDHLPRAPVSREAPPGATCNLAAQPGGPSAATPASRRT